MRPRSNRRPPPPRCTLPPDLGLLRELQGSWSIGIFKGQSPFDLWPLEQVTPRQDSATAWPVANPVLTCASVSDSPSNFGGRCCGGHHSCCRTPAPTLHCLKLRSILPAVADPFLWQHTDGQLYLFYETKTSGTMRGEIGVAASADAGASWTHQAVVLQEQWHLSYPFVFTFGGEVRRAGRSWAARGEGCTA